MRTIILVPVAVAVAACAQPSAAAVRQEPERAAEAAARHSHHARVSTGEPSAEVQLQLETVRRATERYRDIQRAKDDGYVRFGRRDAPLMGEHWYRKDLVRQPLDLARPATLQYAVIGGERVLVGVAYNVYQRPGEPLPDGFAGDDDVWHIHDVEKLLTAVTEGRPILRRAAERGMRRRHAPTAKGRTNLVMLHAWIWLDNPDGVFALHHRGLPYLRAGLPAEWAHGADHYAAQGVALLTPGTCQTDLRTTNMLARLDQRQRSTLRAGCAAALKSVRAAAELGSKAALNSAAALAWRDYEALRASLLGGEVLGSSFPAPGSEPEP